MRRGGSKIIVLAVSLGCGGVMGASLDVAPSAPMFSFSAFGTLGAVHSSEDKADFTASFFKPDGAGHSHAWSAEPDSLIAAQAIANLTTRLSGVVQVISEQNYDGTYRPHVEWANVRYEITPDSSVRVGRIVLPTFLLSETRKVGYTYPWARPPLEVYGILPITNGDGLDASYRLHIAESASTVRMSVGRLKIKLVGDGTAEVPMTWGISNTTETGPLTAGISYRKFRATIPTVNAFFDVFRSFGPAGSAIADEFDVNDKWFAVLAAGASYDPGDWFAMGEWGRLQSRTTLGNRSAWYLSGGYRIGKVTPYVTYARANADKLSDPGLDVATLPAPVAGLAAGLNAALNSLLRGNPVQSTASIGARWDFTKNATVKLQLDRTRIGAGSTGVLANVQPDYQPGGKLNLFSATVDFVFR